MRLNKGCVTVLVAIIGSVATIVAALIGAVAALTPNSTVNIWLCEQGTFEQTALCQYATPQSAPTAVLIQDPPTDSGGDEVTCGDINIDMSQNNTTINTGGDNSTTTNSSNSTINGEFNVNCTSD